MAKLVPFGDIGKATNDLLSKDYPINAFKLEAKTFAPNGVVYEIVLNFILDNETPRLPLSTDTHLLFRNLAWIYSRVLHSTVTLFLGEILPLQPQSTLNECFEAVMGFYLVVK